MIGRSRRQRRSAPSEAEAFALHLRIAARSAWGQRLLRGSLGALLGSVVTVALGWPLWQQAVALGAGFALGAALPVRGQRERALAYLRGQAGMAYETALERGAGDDPFGLLASVRSRALASIRDVRVPTPPAWWLPCLAAALALLALPLASRPAAGGAAGTIAGESASDATDTATGADGEQATAPALPQASPDRVQPPGAGTTPNDASQPRDEVRAPSGGTSDTMTLSRYMETLRQRPSDSAGPPSRTPPDNLQPRSGQGQPNGSGGGAQEGDGQAQPDPSGASTGNGEGNGSGQEGGQQPDTGAGAGSDQGAGGGDQGARPPDANGQDGRQEGNGGPQAGGGQGDAAEGRHDRVDSGTLPGQAGPNGSSEAGNLPGEATPAGPGVEGQPAPPEFLEGQLRAGPENPGGSVRLPGAQDVTLPPGRSAEGYRQAAEQALTEGDLPIEYQDIIRRYFR